ncbi:MAG: hypothetical protein P4L64_00200 [Caulobacteraceae bacterium]|nr:hypothetical protein [Caulobacteraceae bacterium]
MGWFPFKRLVLTAALLAGLSACATPGPLLTTDITSIRAGVAATRDQARTAFEAGNQLAMDQDVAWKLKQADANLRESDFPLPVAPADALAWDNAFGALDAYGAALQRLVAPDQAAATSDAISKLGAQLNSGPLNAGLPSSVQALFATFGGALVQASAEKSATDIMRRADPAFHTVTVGMADAVGDSPRNRASLQFTVYSNWTASLAAITASYSATAPTDTATRRDLIQKYVAAIQARDAQLANLSQLRTSLLALAEAHAAAARGQPGDAQFWIGRINGWLDDIKQRADAAAQAQAQGSAK